MSAVPVPDGPTGWEHPDYPGMRLGGEGEARFETIAAPAFAYGVLTIVFFVSLLGLALRPNRRRAAFPWLAGGGALCVAVFIALMTSYRNFAADRGMGDFVLGFPQPSAIMLYLLWPVPLVFMALYLYYFDRWIWSAEDEEKFAELAVRGRELRMASLTGTRNPEDDA